MGEGKVVEEICVVAVGWGGPGEGGVGLGERVE